MTYTLRSIVARALLALSLLALVGCQPPATGGAAPHNTMADIRASGTIKAGWAPYPPYAELDPATHLPRGFYIEIFQRVAKEAGYKIEWVETTWSNMTIDAKSGRFQVMAAPVFRTIPRATQVAFTRPIDYFGLSAIVRSDNKSISRLDDLRRPGLTIVVTQGEVGQEYAVHNLPQAKLRQFDTGNIALALNDVIDGRADVGIADAWTIRQFVAQHPGAVRDVFAERPFNRVGAGWFVAPDQAELLQFLDTSIDWMISSGLVAEIGAKYKLSSDSVDR